HLGGERGQAVVLEEGGEGLGVQGHVVDEGPVEIENEALQSSKGALWSAPLDPRSLRRSEFGTARRVAIIAWRIRRRPSPPPRPRRPPARRAAAGARPPAGRPGRRRRRPPGWPAAAPGRARRAASPRSGAPARRCAS